MEEISVMTETGEIDESAYEYYQTPVKFMEEEIKNMITEGQNKLKRMVESHMYKIPHFYIIWKIQNLIVFFFNVHNPKYVFGNPSIKVEDFVKSKNIFYETLFIFSNIC